MESGLTDWLETEHKYDVDEEFVIPDLAGLAAGLGVSEPSVLHLTASYFDTPDLRLAAARVTLRRRTGGTDAGWHLKLPVAPGTRRELRAPLGAGSESVPDDLAARASAWTGEQQLRVIAILEHIATPQAQQVLEVLAKSTPNPQVAQAAGAALQRFGKRPANQ